MRSARALAASLGASTCLILAGTLAMAALSTIVAFAGLPGLGPSREAIPTALLAAAPEDRPGPGQSVALALPAVGTAAGVTDDRAARTVPPAAADLPEAGEPARRPGRDQDPAATAGPVPAGDLTAPPSPFPPVRAAAMPPASAPSGTPVRGAGTAASDVVSSAGDGVARALRPIVPSVAEAVGGTTAVAAATVDAATEAAATVVDGIAGGS